MGLVECFGLDVGDVWLWLWDVVIIVVNRWEGMLCDSVVLVIGDDVGVEFLIVSVRFVFVYGEWLV